MKTLLATAAVLALLAGSAFAEDDQGFPEPASTKETRISVSGRKTFIYSYQSISANCKSQGLPTVSITKAPAKGVVTRVEGVATPSFEQPNVRVKCNTIELPATIVYYTSEDGFTGTDYFSYSVVFYDGTGTNYDFKIIVK